MKRADYNISEHLPESMNRDNLREVAETIDRHLHEVDMLSELCCVYPRIDKLSSEFIDALAIQFHVDFYDTTLPLDKRRALVKNSIRWHMAKGTKATVQELVQTVFDSGVVYEWYEYNGEPYNFKVDLLEDAAITPDNIVLLAKVIDTVKNVRSWLDGLGFKRKTTAPIYFAGLPYLGVKYDVMPAEIQNAASAGKYYVGAVPSVGARYAVYPRSISDSAAQSTKYIGGALYLGNKYRISQKEE